MRKQPLVDEENFDYSEMSRVADRLLTPVAVIAPDSTVRYANDELARIVDCDVRQLIGSKILDYVHPEDRAPAVRDLAKIATENPVGGFSRVRLRGRESQGWRVVDVYAHNLTDDPSVRGILVSGGDMTEHENSARALRALSDVTRILVHAKDREDPDDGRLRFHHRER